MAFRSEIKNGLLILLGTAALALGIVLFLAPNRIATGGAPGMAILLSFLSGLPIGLLMLLINLPLLALGVGILGKAFAFRSVVAIALSSAFVDLFAAGLGLQALSHNTLLATLYGGIAVGTGAGLILKGNASAGGTTILARLVAERTRFRPGQVILFFDLFIIVTSGFVFYDIERALWSLISIYVTAKCVDMILTGAPTEKVIHITSGRAALLSDKIVEQLGRKGTIIRGTGLLPDEEKTLIFLTVEARRIALLRDIVRENDPEAFMLVMDATEMLGRGHGL
jgi:uncharacterized membrane-anchored protein YitT (DUF2179 family)